MQYRYYLADAVAIGKSFVVPELNAKGTQDKVYSGTLILRSTK